MSRDDNCDGFRAADSDAGSYHYEFDFDDTSPSRAVLEIIGAITGNPLTELNPLSERIDPGALNRIVASVPEESDTDRFRMEFRYNEYVVSIRGNGLIQVRPVAPVVD